MSIIQHSVPGHQRTGHRWPSCVPTNFTTCLAGEPLLLFLLLLLRLLLLLH